MSSPAPQLRVVMYHYVRDLPRTRFPRIKGLLTADFRARVRALARTHEMATLESALAFLAGDYQPQREMCLLTFDDGLKEHATDVTPFLAEHGIQGVFFLITSCIEQQQVALVHKNHFLMASLDPKQYRDQIYAGVKQRRPELDTNVDEEAARRTYRWDTLEIAKLKYLLNFVTPVPVREGVLNEMFTCQFGDERAFARDLYICWDEAREMQAAGMSLGGHSHCHVALATLDAQQQRDDLSFSTQLLKQRITLNGPVPFSYPYGKPIDSFDDTTKQLVEELRYCCAFSTQVGVNQVHQDRFAIRRIDTKDVRIHESVQQH